jgi:hypothetical protein
VSVPSTSPYLDRRVVFATMHGKEKAAREPFERELGAEVVAAVGLDTDQFGTFSREVERTLTPRLAARAKARLSIKLTGERFALASEGSYSSSFGPVVVHNELLLFVDDERGFELIESATTATSLAGARRCANLAAALEHATRIGLPEQWVMAHSQVGSELIVRKGLRSLDDLETVAAALLKASADHTVIVEPDLRAHASPSRATVIAHLSERMAARLATPCPRCATPGFGAVDVERGLPCRDCGEPTKGIIADLRGCALCDRVDRVERPERTSSPEWCDACNP